mgnify:CR=1 FL=1
MGKIYSAPKEVKVPDFDFSDIAKYRTDCDQYLKDLKAFVLTIRNGKNVGEIVQFPVADGYAQYMVAGMRPLELIHIPLWDGYSFQYVDRLTAKDIQQQIDSQKALTKLFS